MRILALTIVTAGLAACSTAPPPPNPRAEQILRHHLDGKVPGQPVACLASWRADDMIVVDEDTLLFRDNANRVFVNETRGRCPGIGWGHNTLVFRGLTGNQLCRGEIAQVVDLTSGIMAGACALGDFVPYTRPR